MEAPHISTLDTPEGPTPPSQGQSLSPIPPAAEPVPAPRQTSQDSSDPNREVYMVEDDEEDQLIDDDDGASTAPPPSEAPLASSGRLVPVAVVPMAANPTYQEHLFVSTNPAPDAGPAQPVRRPRQTKNKRVLAQMAAVEAAAQMGAASTSTLEPDASGGLMTAHTQTITGTPPKKKRVRTAIKATLEVHRQEPETHDNTGTTSAWRLDGAQNPPIQMVVQQEEPAKPPPPKRKRQPKVPPPPVSAALGGQVAGSSSVVAEATPPPSNAPIPAPVPRKRQKTSKAAAAQNAPTVKSEPSYSQPFSESTPDNVAYEYTTHGPTTHIPQFKVTDLDKAPLPTLDAAPLRPIPHITNSVGPGTYIPWKAYEGPLEKTGKKTRKWTPMQRSIKTIGGGVWYAKTWIGGQHTEIERVKVPLVVSSAKATPEPSAKPAKPKVPRKPRVSKKDAASGLGTAAGTPSAVPTPRVSTPKILNDAAQELEALAAP